MIGIYERVSTTHQSLASQHLDLEQWAQGREVVWYRDRYSGKTMDRPGLQALLTDIRAGKIKTLVVWRLDRLGRTAGGLVSLFDELAKLGVNFVSLKDGIDLSTPAGRMIANILASVAAYETEVRGERIAAGIAAKKERGEKWNPGRKPGVPIKATKKVCDRVKALKMMDVAVCVIGDNHPSP